MKHISILLMMSMMITTESNSIDFSIDRIRDEATIQLNGPIEKVFPLFGPIKEMDWAPGWNPEIVYSATKVVEEHMIFRTKGRFDSEPFYTWIITQYFPTQYLIEYTVSTSERIWFIRVQCKANTAQRTTATISYTFTALTDRGNELNRISLSQMFERRLKDWEEAINHFINTGRKISDD